MRPQAFETFLGVLEQSDLGTVKLEDRCKMAVHIQDYIKETALTRGLYDRWKGQPDKVDEKYFGREFTQLKRLLKSLEYSTAMHALLQERTVKLARDFRKKNPPGMLKQAWDKANRVQRVDILRDLTRMQCRTFGGAGSIDFLPSTVEVRPVHQSIRGYFNLASMDMATRTIPSIVLGENTVDQGQAIESCHTAFHEQLHALLWQFGAAAYHKMVPSAHPLAQDAEIIRARAKYKVHITGFLRSAYYADPEESACHTYGALFES
jgi:hypothetical protein